MKKVLLTFVAVLGFVFTSAAQCDEQSTQLNTSCGSWCVSVQIQLTGNLSSDIAAGEATNWTFRRKPTVSELLAVADELC